MRAFCDPSGGSTHSFTFAVCVYLLLKSIVTRASFPTLLCAAVLQLVPYHTCRLLSNACYTCSLLSGFLPHPVSHGIVWCSFASFRQAV